MGYISKYLALKMLQNEIGSAYVALYRTDPTKDDTGTEVGSAGYERQSAMFSAPYIQDGKAMMKNNSAIIFSPIPNGYGDVSHIAVRDAQYGGNLLYATDIPDGINVPAGENIIIKHGELTISLD